MESETGAAAADARETISLVAIANAFLRRTRVVVGLPIGLGLLTAAVVLLQARTYTASAAFVPQAAESSASRFSAVAAQFGIAMGTSGTLSPDFYAQFLTSRDLLVRVVVHDYGLEFGPTTPNATGWWRGTLIDYFDLADRDSLEAVEYALVELLDRTSVSIDRASGVVSVRVQTQHAGLSRSVVQEMLDAVTDFNIANRQSQVRQERMFVEGRLNDLKKELRDAESDLEKFLRANRDFRFSPSLVFEHDRLQREVQVRHNVFMSLTQAYEQARIEEVRDTPVISIVQSPSVPGIPDRRLLVAKSVAGAFIGLVFAVLIVGFGEAMRSQTRTQHLEEFRVLRRKAVQDLWPLASRK
jgi:tyrosine-protein kinase Etk/Wzc